MESMLSLLQIGADAIKRAGRGAVADAETPDVIGTISAIQRELAAIKKGLVAEATGPMVGEGYRLVERRSATRTYNTAAILAALDREGATLPPMAQALQSGAATVTWHWSKLKDMFEREGIDMRIAHREIEEDGDIEAPMVGEVWKSTFEAQPISPTEKEAS